MFFPTQETEPEKTTPICILSQQNGQLATFTPEDYEHTNAIQVYPVYTRLLPEIDQRQLTAGIEIYSDAQLRQLLEDYGL